MNNFDLDRRARDLAQGTTQYQLARQLLLAQEEIAELKASPSRLTLIRRRLDTELFRTLTQARGFYEREGCLRFRIGPVGAQIHVIEVVLEEDNTYAVRFLRPNGYQASPPIRHTPWDRVPYKIADALGLDWKDVL